MYSDHPPSFVFPDTPLGRERQKSFVAEEPDTLLGTTALCAHFEVTHYPVYTDDDLYRDRSVPPCARRNRSGVRDMNWCCRCIAGLPHTWLSEHDAQGLRDGHHVGF